MASRGSGSRKTPEQGEICEKYSASEIREFDRGLRGQLYKNYDYAPMVRQIEENCLENRIYLVYDAFFLRYIVFPLPEEVSSVPGIAVVGPYFKELEKPDAIRVVEERELELYQVQVLKDYYSGIPVVRNLEHVIGSVLHMLFSDVGWKIEKTDFCLRERKTKCWKRWHREMRTRWSGG